MRSDRVEGEGLSQRRPGAGSSQGSGLDPDVPIRSNPPNRPLGAYGEAKRPASTAEETQNHQEPFQNVTMSGFDTKTLVYWGPKQDLPEGV